MSLSDSRPGPVPRLCIPSGRWVRVVSPPPCRVSQDSSTDLSLRAVPNHPGRLDGCACSLLPRRCQASSSLADWPPSIASRGRIGFDHYGSQVCFPGFRQTDCSLSLRFRYMHERAIYMVNSFQFTRSARLSLVYQRALRTPRKQSLGGGSLEGVDLADVDMNADVWSFYIFGIG